MGHVVVGTTRAASPCIAWHPRSRFPAAAGLHAWSHHLLRGHRRAEGLSCQSNFLAVNHGLTVHLAAGCPADRDLVAHLRTESLTLQSGEGSEVYGVLLAVGCFERQSGRAGGG